MFISYPSKNKMSLLIHNLLPNIIFLSILIHFTVSNDLCGDWEPYKDEKCIKIFDQSGLLSYEDAENVCKLTEESHLISIGVEENQNFIVQFLKSKSVVDNVWLGLKYVNDRYEWTDNTELHFTYWANGSPKNDTNYCVQIQVDDEEFGKWSDFLCMKKNLVICEKIQLWSQNYLQNQVIELQFAVNQSKEVEGQLDSRVSQLEDLISSFEGHVIELGSAVNQSKDTETRLENLIGELSTKLSNLENTITVVTQNPFPVGFIHVQLPNEQSPLEMWPWMGWQDISANYAGVFFRVEGGGSAAFGEVQEENSPRLTHIQRFHWQKTYEDVGIAAGQPSALVDSDGSEDADMGLQFTVSGGEVRPRNMAIRVWKRIQ